MTDLQSLPPLSPLSPQQTLSALMDGEADELETRRFLKEMAERPELRRDWLRYQLAAELVRGERAMPLASLDLADRIQASIGQSHGASGETGHGISPWKKGVASLAVAASFALVVIGVELQGEQGGAGQVAVSQPAPMPSSVTRLPEAPQQPAVAGSLSPQRQEGTTLLSPARDPGLEARQQVSPAALPSDQSTVIVPVSATQNAR